MQQNEPNKLQIINLYQREMPKINLTLAAFDGDSPFAAKLCWISDGSPCQYITSFLVDPYLLTN